MPITSYLKSKRIKNNPNINAKECGVAMRNVNYESYVEYKILSTMGCKMERIHKASLVRTTAMKTQHVHKERPFKSKNMFC